MFRSLIVTGIMMSLGTFCQGQVTCEECLSAVENLQQHLMSETSVAIQSGLLILEMCPLTPDPQVCTNILPLHWSMVAEVAYPFVLNPEEICGVLQVCSQKQYERIWTCEYCESALSAVGDIMAMDDTIKSIVEFLQGDAYCGRPDNHDTEGCPVIVADFMPLAMNILAGYTKVYSHKLCNSIIQEDLCANDGLTVKLM